MKICPKCNTENIFEGAQFCKNCGSPISADMPPNDPDDNKTEKHTGNDLDFVVTEAGAPTAPNFLDNSDDKDINSSEDPIEIASNASLLNDSPAEHESPLDFSQKKSESGDLIGESKSHILPEDNTRETTQRRAMEPQTESTSEPQSESQSRQKDIKKLSKNEIADIRKQLYGDEQPKDKESKKPSKPDPQDAPPNNGVIDPKKINAAKSAEITKDEKNGIKHLDDPAEMPQIEMAPRSRGVAFFRGNFIQIAGKQSFNTGDELVINNRPYVLKPKSISKNTTIGAFAAALVVILTIIGIQFINPAVSGKGQVIGVILDEYGQPYLEGAQVSIPKLGKSTTSNAQGFFRFYEIPTGTYEIEYILEDSYWGSDNVTVTEDQATLTACDELFPIVAEKKKITESNSNSSAKSNSKPAKSSNTRSNKSASAGSKQKSSSSSKNSSKYGKISLIANVPDAKLTVDGNIQGAGNNTYTRIKAGKHTVTVSKPGYQDYTENIRINPGSTYKLEIDLARIDESAGREITDEDYYQLGKDALAKGDNNAAITDLSKAINANPGYSSAYLKRAEAYINSGSSPKAIEDYIRAGEILRLSRQNKQARDAFNAALDLDSKNIIARVGLAGTKYDAGDFRPAITEYDKALDEDKRFYPALYGMALSHFKMGDHKKADKYFKKAYKQDKSDPYLYQHMMLNSFAKDDFGKVRDLYLEYKTLVGAAQLAEFKASSRYAPILRIIKEENR